VGFVLFVSVGCLVVPYGRGKLVPRFFYVRMETEKFC